MPSPADTSVDVEVLVDGTWCLGYLYRRDWQRTEAGRWECMVRYSTRSADGWPENRLKTFDEADIRPV